MLAARDKAKEDAVKLQLALTREMDANKAEAVTQAAELSRMEKELAGTSLCVVFHLDPRRPYSLGLAQVAKQSLVKTAAAAELRSERDRVAADAVQKEQTLVVFREQASRDSELLRGDLHSLQADLTGADRRRRRAVLALLRKCACKSGVV